MTAIELIQHATSLGFRLEPRGGRLAVKPASKLPAALVTELRRHKSEIIRLLTETAGMTDSETPASTVAPVPKVAPVPARKGWGAVPPHNLALVTLKPTPTLANRDLIVAYLARQCASGNLELRAWLSRRCVAYLGLIAGMWDTLLITYAVARDAACWQLDRPESAVWELLAGLEDCHSDLHNEGRSLWC